MLDTNLLPDSEQKFLRTEKLFRTILFAFFLGLLTLAVVAGFFWAMLQVVILNADGVAAQVQSLEKAAQESTAGQVQEKISLLNKNINSLSNNYSNQTHWTVVLEKLLALTPVTIRFTRLDAATEEATLEISGVATSRADLISFQDTLKAAAFVQKMETPLSNIIEKEDVVFEINLVVKKEALSGKN
jgi:Tfp pilus assembly protein PilN